MFGGTSPFSFGSASSASPFGTTPTPNTSTPASTGFLFGSTATPAAGTAAPSALNATFTFGAPTANTATATPAASQPITFGTGLQNTSTIRPFGSTTAFGTTPASTAPATGTTGFGGASLFGGTTTTAAAAAQPTSIFGSTASPFGATSATSTTSMFGAPATPNPQGTTVKFEPVSGQDTMRTKNNTFQTINTKLQCISAMKEYVNKSLEELRMEDYQANRKFPSATTSMFGSTPAFSATSGFNPSPFGTTSAFSATPATSTTTNIFGSSTTTTSPFGTQSGTSTPFSFNTSQPATTSIFGTSPATTTSPFGTATSTAPATGSIFGTTQPQTSIFGSTNTTSPFGAKPATTQSAFGFGTTTSSASPFSFGSQPATSTSIFSQPATSTPFGAATSTTTTNIFGAPSATTTGTPALGNPFGTQTSTASPFGTTTSTAAPLFGAATTAPAFTGFGAPATSSTTTSIFGGPATSTATAAPIFGGFGTQTATSTASPFSFNTTTTTPSIFGSTAAAAPATSAPSLFGSQPFGGFGTTPAQTTTNTTGTLPFNFSTPFGASNPSSTLGFGANTVATATTNLGQLQIQQQNQQSQIASIHQRVLAASLIDPFFSRGKKDFSDIDQAKPPTDLIVLPTSSTTTAITTTTSTTAAAPITLPVQSNTRKVSSGRPLVDIRFRLQPVSSSPTTNIVSEEVKSPNPTAAVPSTGTVKSPLTADFSEEEELVLIGKNKLSKLRLSNDLIHSSFPSESIRSLYPMRQLSELEALTNLNNNTNVTSTIHNIPSVSSTSASTTTIDTVSARASSSHGNEQSLHPSSGTRPMLPLHHSTPLIVHKQSSPPVSHLSTTIVQSPTSPPAPPTTPPPSSSSTGTVARNRNALETEPRKILEPSKTNARAHRTPILTRPDYSMKPSIAELKPRFNDQGQCIVKQFTVEHEQYGSVTFYGHIDVAGLDLDKIIQIDRHEVTVYPDDNNKPPVGEELNIPARITLFGVYPTDRTTREEITDVARIKAMNYVDYLREITKKFDGEFVDYNPTDGAWTFMVQHFTRYGLDGSDDFNIPKAPASKAPVAPVAAASSFSQPSTLPVAKPINPNFLDQTIDVDETYGPSSPKSRAMDMEEKENRANRMNSPPSRSLNQSLLGLRPEEVEQLAQSMFDDDDDDDFNPIQPATHPMFTSTKIIPSTNRAMPVERAPLTEKTTTTMMDADQNQNQITFIAPSKPEKKHVYTTLPKNVMNIRGKYFRTNFSPNLRYASIDRLNETRVLLQSPMNFNDQISENLPEFFEVYYSSCARVLNNNSSDTPQFQVHQNEHVVQRLIEFYNKILDEKNIDENNSLNSLTAYSLEVLELCRLLWAPVAKPSNVQVINQRYYDGQKRREMLSNWLDQCILSQIQSQRWVMQNSEFLSRGLFDECVKYAQDEGDLRLAALIHAASGSNHIRDILRHCAHEDIVDVYSKDFQKTIAILSGEFIVKGENLVDRSRTILWQMAFALHLWFANAASDTISTIVQDFETAFQERYWLEPIAHYGNTKTFDLRWKLLKLYTDETYPMDYVFDVYSYTPNPFDFRLSWMLYMTLQSLGAAPLSVDNDTMLHVNYAQQLENLGLWKWSIFVLLHIQNPANRMKMIDECLHRHVTSSVELTEDEHSLIEKYNLPLNRLLLAKAQRAEYEKEWMNAVRLWIDGKQWRRAHDIYCSFVFHQTLLKGQFDFAKEVLDTLDHQRATISHWNRRGGFIRLYVELLILAEKIHYGQTSLTNRNQTNMLALVHRLCDQLPDVIAEKYLKKISLIDVSRRLLAILNYNLLCSNLPNFNQDNEENLAKRNHFFHQSILSSVPCSLPLDVLVEQIQSHRRLLRP